MDTKTILAVELINSGKLQEGLDQLTNIVAENPNNVPAWYALASFTSDVTLKREALENVSRLDPSHPEAKLEYAKLSQFAQEIDTAPQPGNQDNVSLDVQLDAEYADYNYLELASRIEQLEAKVEDIDTQVTRLSSFIDDNSDTLDGHADIINELVDNINKLLRAAHSHR